MSPSGAQEYLRRLDEMSDRLAEEERRRQREKELLQRLDNLDRQLNRLQRFSWTRSLLFAFLVAVWPLAVFQGWHWLRFFLGRK